MGRPAEAQVNTLIVIALVIASALVTQSLGTAIVAEILVGLCLAVFLLLFVAGWVAQEHIPARQRHPFSP